MKKKTLIWLFLLVSGSLVAQQLPMYSQYEFNEFVYNPALAGTSDYYQVRSNNRFQWVGITDAPRTYILSVNGPHKTLNMGFGGYVFNDVTGPTSRSGIYGCYSYFVKLNDKLKFSTGLSLGVLQYKIDGSKILLHDEFDQTLGNGFYADYMPDAGLGCYLYSDKLSLGIAAGQVLNNNIKFKEVQEQGINHIKNHLTIHAAYRIALSGDFAIEPSVMMKYISPVPVQFDITTRIEYRKLVWMGFSFRTRDSYSALIGYSYKDQLWFGYSYDIPFSTLKYYCQGSHEIMLGIRFNKIKQPAHHDRN